MPQIGVISRVMTQPYACPSRKSRPATAAQPGPLAFLCMQTTLSAMFARLIDTHCATLPGAVAEQPFGPDTQVWKIGGRMFAAHTRGANGVSVKCADGATAQRLIQTRKAISAPYLKRGGWVMFLWENTRPEELRWRLTDSYMIVRSGLPCERQAELPPPPPIRGRAAGA